MHGAQKLSSCKAAAPSPHQNATIDTTGEDGFCPKIRLPSPSAAPVAVQASCSDGPLSCCAWAACWGPSAAALVLCHAAGAGRAGHAGAGLKALPCPPELAVAGLPLLAPLSSASALSAPPAAEAPFTCGNTSRCVRVTVSKEGAAPPSEAECCGLVSARITAFFCFCAPCFTCCGGTLHLRECEQKL